MSDQPAQGREPHRLVCTFELEAEDVHPWQVLYKDPRIGVYDRPLRPTRGQRIAIVVVSGALSAGASVALLRWVR